MTKRKRGIFLFLMAFAMIFTSAFAISSVQTVNASTYYSGKYKTSGSYSTGSGYTSGSPSNFSIYMYSSNQNGTTGIIYNDKVLNWNYVNIRIEVSAMTSHSSFKLYKNDYLTITNKSMSGNASQTLYSGSLTDGSYEFIYTGTYKKNIFTGTTTYCAGNDEPDYYKSYNDKSWNERFDLVELSLKFGRVFIENPNSLEERDRIKIYDSRKMYLEYLPLCSVCVPIEDYFNTVVETFKRMNGMDEFLDYIGVDSRTVSDKWSNLLEDIYGIDGYSYNPNNDKYYCLDNGRQITEKTLLENEYVNFIGNQYVLIMW